MSYRQPAWKAQGLAAAALALSWSAAPAQTLRYTGVAELPLHAAPEDGAEALAVLEINSRVELIREAGTAWCEIRTDSPAQSGFAACAKLLAEPVTVAALRQRLEATRRARNEDADEGLDLVESLFALEPGPEAVAEYAYRLNRRYGWRWTDYFNAPSGLPPASDVERRVARLKRMQAQLRHDALPELLAAVENAQAPWYDLNGSWRAGRGDYREGSEPATPSFFAKDTDIAAYGGGHLARRMRPVGSGDIRYFIATDRSTASFPVLAHIAGALQVDMTAQAKKVSADTSNTSSTIWGPMLS